MNVDIQNELKHYGVLGMRWGHHKRVENPSVIKAKKKYEERKQKEKSVTKQVQKETVYGLLPVNKEQMKRIGNAARETQYSKEDLSGVKILDHLKTNGRSKKQIEKEKEYKKQGMNNDEASIAAYKNIKTKKILMAVGGVTITAAAAYAAYKIHDSRVDKIIKSGSMLQNIKGDPTAGVRDAFYASNHKLDNIKYQGILGTQIFTNQSNSESDPRQVFKQNIKVLSTIKQASPKNAQNVFTDMVKNDKQFRQDVYKYIDENIQQFGPRFDKKMLDAKYKITRGIVDKNAYEMFNVALVDHQDSMQSLANKFFGKLSEKGYNAIKDVNDSKYSGYKSLNPLIVFNSKNIVNVVDIKELADEEVRKSAKIGYASIIGSELVKQGAIAAGTYTGIKSVSNNVKNTNRQKRVNKYRQEHPNSKLTNTEISRMLERGNK